MADARFVYEALRGNFPEFISAMQAPMAKAATAAVTEAGNLVKQQARAAIAAAGFSSGWQNAFRAQTFPKGGKPSLNAAVFFFHKIPYFNVFEEGATIAGSPFLWLPTKNVPLGSRGNHPLTPAQYVARVGPLKSIRGKSGNPILVGAASRSSILRSSATVTKLRKKAVRTGSLIGAQVPMFVGVPSVRIPKKFDIKQIVQTVNAQIGALYLKHLNSGG